MLLARLTLAAAALFAGITTAAAGDIAPGDVKIVDGVLARPVSDAPASAAEGRKIFADRKLGNCLACHANSDLSEQLFHGGVGPSLDGAGERWTPEQLRAIVVDSKAVFGEQTVMPGFYSLDVGVNVRKDLVGKTMLTAVQVESLVAYLATLK
ncbi:MAG TPA: sulfur oxidation c-type cytochrome SoxX [Kiloniellaceae bacterium]